MDIDLKICEEKVMSIKTILRKLIMPNTYSQEAYIEYLRKNGVVIGDNVLIYAPNHTTVDIRKPWLVSIGNNCKITSGVTILAHDYSVSVARRKFGQFVGGSLPVSIGENVFIGIGSTILMGTTIGKNCIVGANSVVKGNFPDDSVIAGNPAKVICSIDDFYNKNLKKWIDNAKRCAKAIYINSGHKPTIEDMSDGYAWLYLERNVENIEKYKNFFTLSSDDYEDIIKHFFESQPLYSSFEAFLEDCHFENI